MLAHIAIAPQIWEEIHGTKRVMTQFDVRLAKSVPAKPAALLRLFNLSPSSEMRPCGS
jgi:hypothetical protein